MSESAPHVRLFVSVDGGPPASACESEPPPYHPDCALPCCCPPRRIRDQENRIRHAIDDLVEFLNVMGAD